MGRGVAAGFPVFLFPALLDHVMSFLVVVRSYSIYQLERFTRSNDVLTLDNVYISLFVRIGWSCPNKVLTPVYEWICTSQDLKEKGGRLLCLPLVYYFFFLLGLVMCKFSFELQYRYAYLILKKLL